MIARRIGSLLCILALVDAPLVGADTVEFELMEFAGPADDVSRSMRAVYSGAPVSVNDVVLHVQGNVDQAGWLVCNPAPDGTEVPPSALPLYLYAGLERTGLGRRWLLDYTSRPHYVEVGPFRGDHNFFRASEFGTLRNGDTLIVSLNFGPGENPMPFECAFTPPPAGELTSVTLILDVTHIVAVETTTWASIKALYD